MALETPGLSWDPQSLVPSRLPDLFEGRPLTILARHNQREGAICLKVTGRDERCCDPASEIDTAVEIYGIEVFERCFCVLQGVKRRRIFVP